MKVSKIKLAQSSLFAGSATLALAAAVVAAPAAAVVPNETKTPEDIVDNEDRYRGVGMIVTNVPGQGGIGICTGTLINPRTVLFAAHCVNGRPETAYDGEAVRAAVAFNVDAFPGILSWFGNSQSNPDLAVFNINRIFWDQRSVQNPQALGFIEADIALASLDTPAAGIPTWAMLFTTLPAPDSIDPVRGTGYHVDIVGYGRSGNAVQGSSQGIDFRRRAAENMLGGFLSLDDRDNFLFGPGGDFLPQNLYQIDFDSQDRSFLFDINVHRDDALPNEGTTGPGDSGGPLILDAANNTLSTEDLVIGVLSGGSRFFGPQPFGAVGTTSFYQPLSLFWQYIVENNPYRYVTAKAGNGNWEDPNHWVTQLDPAYRVINAGGQVVNGLPTTPELGLNGRDGDFGGVCVEFANIINECIDVGTGVVEDTTPAPTVAAADAAAAATVAATENGGRLALAGGIVAENASLPGEVQMPGAAPASREAGAATAGTVTNGAVMVDVGEAAATRLGLAQDLSVGGAAGLDFGELIASGSLLSEADNQPQEMDEPALPTPTLANGLPGASGFVPNNIDPVVSADPAANVNPRYYDVTLSADGTTTLSSDVTIDRLTIRNAAGLTIAQGGALTSLIDINQFGGRTNVNGTLTSGGDFTLFSGMLEGTGTINAPFVTSIAGALSPSTMGGIGTLTFNGNLIMASGTTFLVDLNGAGASDMIAVNGAANLGGIVGLGAGVTQQVNGLGRNFTILTATDGVTGAFTATTISPILSQAFTYTDNAVLMQINAASYRTVIDAANPVQSAYAQLWDQNRPNAALAPLYALDFQSTGTIRDTFNALAPVTETTVQSLALQSISALQNFNASRQREADRSRAGGKIAVSGSPLEVAGAALNPMIQPIGATAMALQADDQTRMSDANLPESVGIFLAAGALSGQADAMPGYRAERTSIDGFFVAGGVEFYPAERTVIGLSAMFNSLNADAPLGQTAESETFAGSFYIRSKLENGLVFDGQLSLGGLELQTERQVNFLGGSQTLQSRSRDNLLSGGIGVSYDIETGIGTISPGVEGRHASVRLDPVSEQGGNLALTLDRDTFKTTQARAGVNYRKQTGALQFNLHGQYVWELEDGPQLIGANFVTGIGPAAGFLRGGIDDNWAEVGASLNYGSGPFQIGAGVETTIGRRNADMQIWRVQGTYRF